MANERPFGCPICGTDVSIYMEPSRGQVKIRFVCSNKDCLSEFHATIWSWNLTLYKKGGRVIEE